MVLAGNEVAIPLLREALSRRLAELVQDVLRLDIRAPLDTVAEEVKGGAGHGGGRGRPDDRQSARRGSSRRWPGRSLRRRRAALEHGQVDELVLDSTGEIDESTRGDLVRLAQLTSATVEVVERHDWIRTPGWGRSATALPS